jgi:hypothetical protein
MPVKKSKRKLQHKVGIEGFEDWCKKHPKATHKEKFEQFDMFIDTSQLVEDFNVLQAAAS